MASVIIPLGALLIAILSVAALWLWWTGDSPPELAAEQGSSSVLAEGFSASAAEMTSAPVLTGSTQSSDEVLRIVRGSDGQLQILMNGVTYHSLSEMNREPGIRDRFMSTLGSLSQFAQEAGGVSAAPSQVSAQPVAQPIQQARPAAVIASAPGEEIVEADPNSMAAQIERFLQDRLVRTPGMMSRSIHIYSTPSGGVQIKVDSTLYESVGDVDDPDAREIIEAAIRDWEASLSV
jgi:hypothetical protein